MSTKVFEDKSGMTPDSTDTSAFRRRMAQPADSSVQVVMTPDMERSYLYPFSDAMSVRNVMRPRRGHGY